MSADTATTHERRWWLLGILGSAQLMVVLDNSIVNIALPAAQGDLGFDGSGRQWVVTSYALAFGCLLLLGGRLSDLLGRRRTLVLGLVGFAAASALGGAAIDFAMLVAARVIQGAFGALLAPTVLSLISETFPGGRVRARAFGILSAIVGSGAAIGLVLGGALTEYLNWRATMYVNVVFAVISIVGATVLIVPDDRPLERPRIDTLGAVLACLGLSGLVFGLGRSEAAGWSSATVLGSLGAGVLVLAGFVWRQHRARHPLVPLSILTDRNRAGALVSRFTASIGNFAVVFFMSFFLQESLGLSPVLTGLAMVPMVLGIVTGSNLLGPIVSVRLGPRWVSVIGLVLAAGALASLGLLSTHTGYWSGILVPLLVFGFGQGATTSVAMSTATAGLPPHQVGVTSGLVSVMQQLGGAIGTALLSSIAAAVTAGYLGSTPAADATVRGYGAAFWTGAGIFAAAALVSGLLIRHRRAPTEATPPEGELTQTGGSYDRGAPTVEHGRVLSAHKRPLAGATVTLVDDNGHQQDRVLTDANGVYHLATTPRRGLLVWTAPGHHPEIRRSHGTAPPDVELLPNDASINRPHRYE